MDLSIIIVSFNTKELTLKCIDSILASRLKILYEIIVVDNGSSDGSQENFKRLSDKRIKLILNDKNLGFAKANNIGIKSSRGIFKLLLNSDTEIRNSALNSLYNFAKAKKSVGVVGARLLNPDGSIQGSVYRLPTIKRTIYQYWLNKGKFLDKYYPESKIPVEVEAVVGGAFLITSETIEKAGLLDERYFMYFEDIDYCRRVREAGLKVYYLPTAEIIHHHGASPAPEQIRYGVNGKKLADVENQWRRLIPSSKIYHGIMKHYLINFIIWSGQKWQKLFKI